MREVRFDGNLGRKGDDVQSLRSLLERLEAHTRIGPHPNGSTAVWEAERDVLVARVNAYSALVFATVSRDLEPQFQGRALLVAPHKPGCAALRNPDRLCDCRGVHARGCAIFDDGTCNCERMEPRT